MKTDNGDSGARIRRDATAGGGLPVTGDRFAGDLEGTIERAFLRAGGLSRDEVRRRPIIGICSSWSELNPCNMGLRDLAESVRSGVAAAGGTAVVFPTISLNENMIVPTSMLLRNLMAMDVEEMIRCSPIDGVVLLAGCDKTVPAQLMGAASAGKPAIMLTAGPRGCGQFQGRSIVTSDVWDLVPDRLEGRISDAEWDELEGVFAPTVGVCNVMGTATTMAIAAEVLGMALPGSAAVPAVESRRRDLAERTGVRAVELARAGTRPEDVMTPPAFDNAIRVLSATGGSTNEFIHLVAIAGRLGISLGLDRFADIGERTPQVLGVRPSVRSRWRISTMPAVSPPCWRCWSPCWTAAAFWVTGGSWPTSVPLCAPRRRGPIPACVPSMILSSTKVDSSCCVVRLLRGARYLSGRRHRACCGPTAVPRSSSTTTPPASGPTIPACTRRRTA